MKNVFFALAFMLVGTFAFANSAKIADLPKHFITVVTSCGEEGMIIVREEDSMSDVINMAMDLDEWLCG